MVVFGRPTRQQQDRPKPRRAPLEQLVHQNGYRTMDGEELRRLLDHNRGERPYEEWLTAFCQRKYQSDFSREMTRSVAEYLTQYKTQYKGVEEK
jgi:hypothetical protein